MAEDNRRFTLSDEYDGNFTVPVKDNLLRPKYDKMFITEVVDELNYLNGLCKDLWEENRKLRKENEWLTQSNRNLSKRAYPMQGYIKWE
jgi:hypothetical protein